ncbi:hypothetical protein EWU23_04935 [Cytophagaceae bacterium 50C-KIRBA]|uniref:DUF1574 domain-containing protein n=1 Tax=Aquirufa beregesia TaxID=2516556 RepID=A0ABX0EX23_9BACT|nr:hypothetical protein [Aquirufa beregesia]NGZ43817.1 hypothetical protein [Aquirufa beregesia]
MRLALKLLFWLILLSAFVTAVDWHEKVSGTNKWEDLKSQLAAQKDTSNSMFFLGSSRIQRSVNPQVLAQALPNWRMYNLGLIGNSLAQNLFIAEYLKTLPGNKVVFIELTSFIPNFPDSFKQAGEQLKIPHFPSAYFSFVGKEEHQNKDITYLENMEVQFWERLIQCQNLLKSVIYQNDFNGYEEIGFSSTNRHDVFSTNSFLTTEDLHYLAHGPVDKIMHDRVNQALKKQVPQAFKIVFLLPVTSPEKLDFKRKIPTFNKIAGDSKWVYDEQFLREMANSANLENRNHMNSRGAYIYSQGLIKYIKANEKNW